jgi:uncharacterized membrane protein SpoIIM required for sporulation
MRVVDRLAARETTWRELDVLLFHLDGKRPGSRRRPRRDIAWIEPGQATQPLDPMRQRRKLAANEVVRLGELYRSACADLMLAEAYDLPRETVAYLHALVARAHNALYRARGFRFRDFAGELFGSVPRRLRSDPLLRVAALLFYVPVLVFALLSAGRPHFAEQVMGEEQLDKFEQMYARPLHGGEGKQRDDAFMAGFYIFNNASIGLRCFAFGLAFGVGTIYILFTNAMMIGTAFGHMATSPSAANFYTFVTAHAPFELTAIVFSAAAGLRLGQGLIVTHGMTRLASLRREARGALPTVGAAVFLFILAAFLEGFVSASSLPYAAKAGIAIVSALALIAYLALGGRGRPMDEAMGQP